MSGLGLARKAHAACSATRIAHLALLVLLALAAQPVRAQQIRLDAYGAAGVEDVAAPQPAIALPQAAPVGRYATLLDETPGQALTLAQAREQLASGRFRRSQAAVPNLGNLAPPMWLHLALDNTEPAPLAYRLYIAEGWADRVDAWLVAPDQPPMHWQVGDMRSPSRFLRPGLGFAFDANLPPGRSELFVRADSIDAAALALRLVPLADAAALEGPAQRWLGLVHGFLLALVVTYGLLWLALRETSLLRYVAYVAAYLYMHLSYSGVAARMAWPDSPEIARYAILVGMVLFSSAGLWFARDFLRVAHWAPRLDRVVAWLVRIALLAMAVCIVTDRPAAAVSLAFAYIMLFTLLMVVLGVLAALRQREQARIFLAASLVSMAGAFVTTLAVMGHIPFNALTFRAVELGVMTEASMWALALGLRLRRVHQDHADALQMAQHDALTGLCNRRGFIDRALPLHARAQRERVPLAVVLIDLDHFKAINDRYGHDAGDRALVAVAEHLRTRARRQAVVARWGGEEFVLLLSDVLARDAGDFAERLRSSLAALRVPLADGDTVSLTASLGVSAAALGASLDDLLRQADTALYAAKQAGRNQVVTQPLDAWTTSGNAHA
jgi:diguanylate cyclase (GGDEF)-like protein